MQRRKTLEQRDPELIYMIRAANAGEPGPVYIRGWLADETGSIDHSKPVGEAHTGDIDPKTLPPHIWFSSKDTEYLNLLPPKLHEELYTYDDAVRVALAKAARDPAYAAELFQQPAHAYLYGIEHSG